MMILEFCDIVSLLNDQVTVGDGRPFIRQLSLNNEPRATDVVTGGE